MKTTKILIAGFGGQGVLFAGKFLANKGMHEQLQVSWLPSYGPEMRGGTANCNVILSEEPIGSPIISKPDVLVAMNLPSLQKYVDTVESGGEIYVDSTLVNEEIKRSDVKVYRVPATRLAKENGMDKLANMILIGHLLQNNQELTFDGTEELLEKLVPPTKKTLLELNLKALQMGKNYIS